MQINAKQFNQLLKKPLFPVYLISGDCIFQKNQLRQELRQYAKKQDFLQRHSLSMDSHFDWSDFSALTQNRGLFDEKNYIELHNPKAKFDKTGLECLQQYLDNPIDTVLVIQTEKLTNAQKKAKWFTLLEKKGAIILVWPIATPELPAFIHQLAHTYSLTLETSAVSQLIELTEGNLLATQQALEKLALLHPLQTITKLEINTVMSDSARFSIFDLSQYYLQGNTKRALTALHRLKETNPNDLVLILWVMTRDIRAKLQDANRSKGLELAHLADLAIKGLLPTSPWDYLDRLVVLLSGKKLHGA